MANAFALLVQQRPMTEAEIADERKAAEMPAHSPLVARYMPGQQQLARGKGAWNDKALKSVDSWGKRQVQRIQARKHLPRLSKAEDISDYIKARKRAYADD